MSERFEGNFLESADLMGLGSVTLTICEVIPENTEKDSQGRSIDKLILVFQGAKKRWICGKTNQRIIKSKYGQEDNWSGKDITLCVRYLKNAFGEANVPTIRVQKFEGIPLPFAVRKHYGKETPYEEIK